MRNRKESNSKTPLKERAKRAWREERPKRVAELLERINLAFELREKLEEVLGDDLPIKILTELQDRPVATVEELRFTLANPYARNLKSLMLIDSCPRCAAETGFIINTLADLGQLFEGFGTTINIGCTECIGLTDDDLKPSYSATVQSQK